MIQLTEHLRPQVSQALKRCASREANVKSINKREKLQTAIFNCRFFNHRNLSMVACLSDNKFSVISRHLVQDFNCNIAQKQVCCIVKLYSDVTGVPKQKSIILDRSEGLVV